MTSHCAWSFYFNNHIIRQPYHRLLESMSELDTGTFTAEVIAFIVLLLVVFIMALAGNIVVIVVVVKYIRQRSITNKFIVSLAVADLFTGIAAASQVLYLFVPELNNYLIVCLLRYQVVTFMTLTSQLTVTFITFDRYIAVCYPHSYQKVMTRQSSNFLIAIAWCYSFIIFILPFAGLNIWTEGTPCIYQLVVEPGQLLAMALTLWIFTTITVIMYGLIVRRARLAYRQIQPSFPPETASPRAIGSVSSSSSNAFAERAIKIRSALRGAKALATITLLFALCWLPFSYFQFRAFIDRNFLTSNQWHVANWIVFLGMTNSIINPFIYAWQRKDFNQACKRLFCRKKPVIINRRLEFITRIPEMTSNSYTANGGSVF